MVLLGAHVSISGSIALSVDRARELGCTTFQIFTRNPRGWISKKLKDEEVEEFVRRRREAGYEVVVAHMPYLPNVASPEALSWRRSVKSLAEELQRCEMLGLDYLVCHIGSHMGKGIERGIAQVARAVNETISRVEAKCMILLENMAGQKNSVGSYFPQIRAILDKVDDQKRVGVCLDTCHLYAAGYDISVKEGLEKTLSEFDESVGLKALKVLHLNDSRGKLGSHLDRHEHIGRGYIGEEGFRVIVNHKSLRGLPMILETPQDEYGGYEVDLEVVRRLLHDA
ncbi:putative endonuclease 4 [Candidatus Calditenuaceae archaeon HR02]|nr:putative endonuclease 4 [Candidatus Calditenuaceae archaeon HR02]